MSGKRNLLITGVCGGVGRVLLRRAIDETEFDVIGADKRNWVLDRPDRFRFEQLDLRRNKAEDLIRTTRPWGLVHLAFVSDQTVPRERRHVINVLGTKRVLDWCVRFGVKKVVLLSRATVYGARPDNPSLIDEEMPLRLSAAHSELSDLVEFDHMVRSVMWEHRELEVVLLRPVHIVGPNIREGMLFRYLQPRLVMTALGFNPMMQLIHEEDVIGAILAALRAEQARGIYNVPGPGALPLIQLIQEVGRRHVPVPHPLLSVADRVAFGLGLSKLPPGAIDFLRFPCIVDGQRITREIDYEPRFGLRATLATIPTSAGAIVA